MVEIQINSNKILLVAIYAPNEKQDNFLKKLYEDEIIRKYEHICLVGDFSAILDKIKDYEKEDKRKSQKKLPKVFFQMMEELGLIDIWRKQNTEKKTIRFLFNTTQIMV